MSEDYSRYRNRTITFRVSEQEKRRLDARIETSNIKKTDYYIQSCLYGRIMVIGDRKNIDKLIDELNEMELFLRVLLEEIQSGTPSVTTEQIKEIKDDYIAMVGAIYDIAKAGKDNGV